MQGWRASRHGAFREPPGTRIDALGAVALCLTDLAGDVGVAEFDHGARHRDTVLAHLGARPLLGFHLLDMTGTRPLWL
jgi:hypothetical protein